MTQAKNIQLVLPMAGLGSRFVEAGYVTPKPLLDIHGAPMFEVVLANLLNPVISKVVCIIPRAWGLATRIESLGEALETVIVVVEVDGLTDGPAGSVALAESHLDPDLPVVTANSDQYLDADLGEFYQAVSSPQNAGAILAMEDSDPKWSYARVDSNGRLVEVREKVVISNLATVGVYGFQSAQIMFDAFQQMRADGASVNGEYYVAPAYNYLIGDAQGKVVVTNLGPVGNVMHGLGIPSDYESFLVSDVSLVASESARLLLGGR